MRSASTEVEEMMLTLSSLEDGTGLDWSSTYAAFIEVVKKTPSLTQSSRGSRACD